MPKLLKSLFFFCLFAQLSIGIFAQDASHLRISLLTCTPGEELYSTFGHSAFRVIDSSKAVNDESRDYVYNYGTFNFDDDGFYMKFIRGKLLYYVAAGRFADFMYEYQMTKRGVTEQVLNLTPAQKINILSFLNNNIKEENRYYQYDFFLDNCTTRLRDILKKNHDSSFTKKPVMPAGTTFRQAIYQYLDKNDKQWSKLGIDILLGQRCDNIMTAEQMQFLPDNLMISLDSAKVPMALSHQELLTVDNNKQGNSIFSPLVIFSLLLVAIAAISQSKNKLAQKFLHGFDGMLFFIIGLLGIMLMFMWYGTDHSMTKNNYNLIWAWPPHIIIAFFVNSHRQWVKRYFAITSVALVLVLLAWFFLRQHLNISLIPIVLLLIYRSATKVFFENRHEDHGIKKV